MAKGELIGSHRYAFTARKARGSRVDWKDRGNRRTLEKITPPKAYDVVIKEAQQLSPQLWETREIWNEETRGITTFAEVAFAHDLSINKFMAVRRNLPEILERADAVNPHRRPATLLGFDEANVYGSKVGGISLLDIEKMETPIEWGKMDSIVAFLGQKADPKNLIKTQFDNRVKLALITFVVQNKLDSDGYSIPSQIRALYTNMTDFLDYCMELQIASDLSSEEAKTLSGWLEKGSPDLQRVMAAYIPAALGITPASTMKALWTNAESLGKKPDKFIPPEVLKEAGQAYRRDIIPEDLEPYIQYDPNMDKKVHSFIGGYYRRASDIANADQESTDLLVRSQAYFRRAADELIGGNEGAFSFNVDGRLIDEVVVTAEDKRSLIFIIKFKHDKVHLTLDFTADGNIYGFPPGMTTNSTRELNGFARDVLAGYLQTVRGMYPGVDEEEYIRQHPIQPQEIKQPEESSQNKKGGWFKNLPVLKLPSAKPSDFPQAPLEEIEISAPVYTVVFTRESIDNGTKAKGVDQKTADRVVNRIRDIELGRVPIGDADENGNYSFSIDGVRVNLSTTGGRYLYLESITLESAK